ncbi:MAG: PorT family protein [Bacteroidetes bacterium]|nr:PorT family protein [Bacteroidota bacterium]
MKSFKVVLVACFALVAVSVSHAQVRFDIGVKGGLNFASLSASSTAAQNYNNRTGYHVGAYALIKIAKFGIQPEVIFSKQGQTYSIPSINSNAKSNFDYINIPIMLKLYLAGGLNLQAGPQFGFLAGSSGYVFNTATSNVTVQSLSSLVKSSDVSLALGAGWDLPFGLSITGRYNLGLSDLNKQTGVNSPLITSSLGTKEAKNQVIQISVGYRLFKLGK